MDMSIAEWFLLCWAILATLLAGFFFKIVKHGAMRHAMLANMLAEVVWGDITPKYNSDRTGFELENDDMRIGMMRRDGKQKAFDHE